jgi:hypothetical protein
MLFVSWDFLLWIKNTRSGHTWGHYTICQDALSILPERDGRGLGTSHEMAPAPGLTGGVKLFHHDLMVLKRMHFGEVVVVRG